MSLTDFRSLWGSSRALGLRSSAVVCALACTKSPAPRVVPEALDAGRPAAVIAAPAAPAEGPCALAIAGGADVLPLHGRVDRVRIAAAGGRARLVGEVVARPGATAVPTSVDVAPSGAMDAPAVIEVGAAGTRVVGAPLALGGALETFRYGARKSRLQATDFAMTHRFVLGELRSEQRLYAADELAAASDGARWVAVTAGDDIFCYGESCEGEDRQSSGMSFHPRVGYVAQLVRPNGEGMSLNVMADVECADILATPPDGEDWLVETGGTPGDRCRAVRSDRAIDVAVALHGALAGYAWHNPRGLWLGRVGVAEDAGAPEYPTSVPTYAGDYGATAVTFRGDDLVAVFAHRPNPRAPYRLSAVVWPASAPTPPAPRPLATGAASAFAPAVAVRGPYVVLAWMEGDDRTAQVRVGATALGLERAIDHAITVSAPNANARDPELAVDGDRVWMAWSEYPGARRRDQGGGAVRVSPLRLPGT